MAFLAYTYMYDTRLIWRPLGPENYLVDQWLIRRDIFEILRSTEVIRQFTSSLLRLARKGIRSTQFSALFKASRYSLVAARSSEVRRSFFARMRHKCLLVSNEATTTSPAFPVIKQTAMMSSALSVCLCICQTEISAVQAKPNLYRPPSP